MHRCILQVHIKLLVLEKSTIEMILGFQLTAYCFNGFDTGSLQNVYFFFDICFFIVFL